MKKAHKLEVRTLFVTLLLVLGIILPGSAAAQNEGPPLSSAPLPPVCEAASGDAFASLDAPGEEPPRVYVVGYEDKRTLNALAGQIDIWEIDHEAGTLVAMLRPAQAEALREAGLRVEVDVAKTYQIQNPPEPLVGQISGIPGYPCYRTVEETYATAEDIVATYPQLATWTDIGDSWEKTEDPNAGYDLMVLRFTNADVPGPKPKLFVMAAMHARELTPAELATRFAEALVQGYDVDPDITWLLDYHEIHLLLQANPDGRKQAEGVYPWRKNTNENYCSPTSNSRGADLNRNYPFQWGCCNGSSGSECSETYRGPSPASEPETQAVVDYVRGQFPDQRGDDLSDAAPDDAMGVFLDIHSYSEMVLWSWGYTYEPAPNGTALQTLGRKFAYFNGYKPSQSSTGLYFTDGTTDGFAYGELGLAAYTFELGTSFFQSCSYFENNILADNLEALLYAAKVARTPYLTPAGPDVLNLAVAPDAVHRGTPFTLTGTLDDTRYNHNYGAEPTQSIAAAEYYVDTPPWATGTPSPQAMNAVDGAFDETEEEVTATLATDLLEQGRHILYVRGRDSSGNWGPFSAVFVEVLPPVGPPRFTLQKAASTLTPEVGLPLTYTLVVTNSGGYASGVTITETLPSGTQFAWADEGGTFSGSEVVWDNLHLTYNEDLRVSYGVTVSCVTSGTQIVNDLYHITATEHPTPTWGLPLTVTAQAKGITADFTFPALALTDHPLAFTSFTTNAADFAWTFGDGDGSNQHHPQHAYNAVGTFTTTLTATNACDSAVARHPVTVETYNLSLSTSTLQQVGDPGQILTFTARLTNTGTLSDTLDLTLIDNEWTAQLVTNTVFLDEGASAPLLLTVTVPVSAEGSDNDAFTLRARASSDPRSSPATAHVELEAVASTLYGVFLTADTDALTITPGGAAHYTLELVNASNVVATVTLTRTNTGWPTTLSPTSLDVAPAGRRQVDVEIDVPLDVPLDAVDIATIRATVQDAHQDVVLTTRASFTTYLPWVMRD